MALMIKQVVTEILDLVWPGGVMVRMLNSRFKRSKFDSRPFQF